MSLHQTVQPTNPFSTGGGGTTFEHMIQATFALSLISDGFTPEVRWPIKELHFQAKRLGYDTDDLAVELVTPSCPKNMLLCQMKHDITVSHSKNNPVFQSVINAAWSDFNKGLFNKEYGRILLITGVIAKTNMDALYTIHEQALSRKDSKTFMSHMAQSNIINRTTREKFHALRACLKEANQNEDLSDDDFWHFCRCFCLCVFDIELYSSINRCLVKSLIRTQMTSDCRGDISLIWKSLIENCAEWNQRGADISRDDIPDEILQKFDTSRYSISTPISLKPTDSPLLAGALPSFVLEDHWEVLALLGKWDDSNANDQQVIEHLANCKYPEFRAKIQRLSLESPEFISHKDNIWTVKKRCEILKATSTAFFDDTIQMAFTVVEQQLSEKNRRFDSNNQFSTIIPSTGCFSHSIELRRGILEGLCVIANHISLKNCSRGLIKRLANTLIYNVLHDCCWCRWASISDLLPLLAEIAPKEYLNQLETFIADHPNEMRKVFPKQKDDLFSPNFMAHILRSLEMLAWSEEYLVQCIRCLGALESLGYEETNHANTPAVSIVNILFPFYLQTNASIEKQKNAVKTLEVDYPDVCWGVLLRLLPSDGPSVACPTAHPKFTQAKTPESITLSTADQSKLFEFYSQLICNLAGDNNKRILDLLQRLWYMSFELRARVLCNVASIADKWNDTERNDIWIQLQKLLPKEKSDSSEKFPQFLAALKNAIAKTEPISIIYKYRQKYMQPLDDYSEYEAHKQQIVNEVYTKYGIKALIHLADSMDNDYSVASFLGNIIEEDEILTVLPEYETGANAQFYSQLIRSYLWKNGIEAIEEMKLLTYPQEFRAVILLDAPFSDHLIQLLSFYLPDKENLFWEKINAPIYSCKHADYDITVVVEKYLQCGRAAEAVNLFGYSCDNPSIDDALIYKLLGAVLRAPDNYRLNEYSCQCLIKYLQNSPKRDLRALSYIEFAYYPFLQDRNDISPRALNYLLSNDPAIFCRIIELLYKKHHDDGSSHQTKSVSDNVLTRLYSIIHSCRCVPGTNWNGDFCSEVFQKWFKEVEAWSIKNDRYEVALHTIGSILVYAPFDENGLLHNIIMDTLNMPLNKELRTGYEIGVFNNQDIFFKDSECTADSAPELTCKQRAEAAEAQGYSRFADTLNKISNEYIDAKKKNSAY